MPDMPQPPGAVPGAARAPLRGLAVLVADDPAAGWAGDLLASLGAGVAAVSQRALLRASWQGGLVREVHGRRTDATSEWARSGAMHLTGRPEGAPLAGGAGAAVAARGAALALELLSAILAYRVKVDGARLLGERAALAGLSRRGAVSAGGGSRLLPTVDGWVAMTLARPDDVRLVAALVEGDVDGDGWDEVAGWLRRSTRRQAEERARLLGLPCSGLPAVPGLSVASKPPLLSRLHVLPAFFSRRAGEQAMSEGLPAGGGPWRWSAPGTRRQAPVRPLVVDLSSLWAGPLAASLLTLAGARVLKVESSDRLDGARQGSAAFFDLLNAGAESVILDLGTPEGRGDLRRLLTAADVVVEGSRPRALRQLGIDAEAIVAGRPGLTWLSLTAHGRTGGGEHRVGYGDDTAAAGGLVAVEGGAPVFAADAVADPLAGLHVAVAALAGLAGGGGLLAEVALVEVARAAATLSPPSPPAAALVAGGTGWTVPGPLGPQPVELPRARRVTRRAPAAGADTVRVLRAL